VQSRLSHLECSGCGMVLDAAGLRNRCPGCSEPLLCRYALDAPVGWPRALEQRPQSLWRYWELLPLKSEDSIVALGETLTPLIPLPASAAHMGVARLLIKDEGLLPTGSFKARGAAVGVARLRELGGSRFVMPTNGNAGAAWSLYAARAGLEAHIVIPEDAPLTTRRESVLAVADVTVCR
jgi:threonine synthase